MPPFRRLWLGARSVLITPARPGYGLAPIAELSTIDEDRHRTISIGDVLFFVNIPHLILGSRTYRSAPLWGSLQLIGVQKEALSLVPHGHEFLPRGESCERRLIKSILTTTASSYAIVLEAVSDGQYATIVFISTDRASFGPALRQARFPASSTGVIRLRVSHL